MKLRVFAVVLCVVTMTVAAMPAQTRQGPANEAPTGPRASDIDRIFAPWDSKTSPGCAVGVFKDGALAFSRGYGMASLEHDMPIGADTVFYAGSVSKQFTAMAVALAIQQGKLAYDDSIRTYLPELPAYADAITINHLLHHTSGLRDYNTLLTIAGRRDEDAWDNRVVLQMTARQTHVNFAPGDEYLYSNTGYTLLATIVERATGTAFAAFADANIFKPLDMSITHYHVDASRLVHGRALAYAGREGQWTLDTPVNQRAGAGGLYTSIRDLLKWDENFYTGHVGGADVLKEIQTQGTLNNGKTIAYAWGLELGSYRGLAIVEHGGALGGYRAHILRVPSQHTSVALLCNLGTIAPAGLARRVADLVIGDRFRQPVPGVPPGTVGSGLGRIPDPLPLDALRGLAGAFYSEEVDATFTVTVSERDGRLMLKRETDAEPAVLVPDQGTNQDQYRARGLTIRFQRGASGAVMALSVDAGRVRNITFVRR